MRLHGLTVLLATTALTGQGAAPATRGDTVRLEVRPPDYRFRFRPAARIEGQRPLVLALGGGAAKGLAHVGVLQRLEEEGFEAEAIAGTSAGAFVGALQGCGYSPAAMEDLFRRMDLGAALLDRQRRTYGETLLEQESRTATVFTAEYGREGFTFTPGASSGLELKRSLQWLLSRGLIFAGTDFSKLRAPLRAVSTNLQDGVAEAPASGNLVDAVRASMSIPGLFRPVVVDGKQHVDGLLVENLPVFEAREMGKGLSRAGAGPAAVLAVEVGGQLDDVRAGTLFGLAVRSLDVAIEARTRLSREAADLLVRPDTRALGYLDFSRQVPEAVALGRASLDHRLDDLERLLYGPLAEGPAPGPLDLQAPLDIRPAVEALAKASLPAVPPTRRDQIRLLRRLHVAGLAAGGSLAWDRDATRLVVEPHGLIRTLRVEAPSAWRGALETWLASEGLVPGARFNPARLARALDAVLVEATLHFRPLVDFAGTSFEDGTLLVRCHEPDVARVEVRGGEPRDRRYLERLMAGLEGQPLNARAVFQRLSVAESRLNLEELALGGTLSPGGPVLDISPVPRSRTEFDVSLAFESTWGLHTGLGSRWSNALGSGNSLELAAGTNRLQERVDLDFRRALHGLPRTGFLVFARHFAQRFLPEGLQEPALLAPLSGVLADRTLRARDLGLGVFLRFGNRDQGLWRLEAARRWTALLPGVEGAAPAAFDGLQTSLEWDSFDRYAFPTGGTLVRASLGEGQDRGAGQGRFRHAYLRLRHLRPLGRRLGASLDLESGLGRDLPLDRWHSLGGPAFLQGTRSAGYLAPNFAVARLGFPIRMAGLLGLQAQLEPRWDSGYVGSLRPSALRDSVRVRGWGLALRTEVGRFYVEIAAGKAETSPEGQPFRSRGAIVNLLVGTRPFDLWQRR